MLQLITNYWTKNQNTEMISNLLANVKKTELDSLNSQLKDLLRRLNSCAKSVPLLPGGGGRTFKLTQKHIPHIEYLQKVTNQACFNCEQYIEARGRKNREAQASIFNSLEFDLLSDVDFLQGEADLFEE